MSYDNLNCASYNLLKFYQLFTGEERRIPFIFDDFHFRRSRVIGLNMTENKIFTLCRMITWVVFLRMFWNFISSLLVKRGGSLSFLVGTISNVLVMEIGWTDVGSGGYILVSCAHSNTSSYLVSWSEHAHIIPISRMVDFCESYSPFHVCLPIRPSAHLVYATSHLSFVAFYSYLLSWLAMICACAYYTDFTDGWFLREL